MSIDKTTLNRIRIAIQHMLCSANDDEVNHESMAKACVDFGIIEKEEDFDDETFTHAPILFEMIWEKVGDGHFKTPLELFEAWYKDEVAIYRLGEEIEDFSEFTVACNTLCVILSGRKPVSNFLFVGKDFAKLYIDRDVMEINDMQREAFELMQEYAVRKESSKLGLKLATRLFGRKKEEVSTTKEGRKFIKMYDTETGEYLGPLIHPMTHEEAHGKEPKSKLDVKFNKEAWSELKYEHDTSQPHFKLDRESLFNPDTSTLEIKIDKEEVDKLANILALTDEEIQEKVNASKNAAEIFCHATNGTYEEFNQYASEFGVYIPSKGIRLPAIMEPTIRTLKRVGVLSDINVNESLLVYAIYKKSYENNKFPYTYGDIVYDIVDSMVTLKEEGMIQ
jgi:hypothetical protein|nr:MAG TPA: hypothetical protein [Caudoviricetes sp.]